MKGTILLKDVERENLIKRHCEYTVEVALSKMRRTDYIASGVDWDDIRQEGQIAVVDAVDSYDPEKGTALDTWIINRVRWKMMNAFNSPRQSLKRDICQGVDSPLCLDEVLIVAGSMSTPVIQSLSVRQAIDRASDRLTEREQEIMRLVVFQEQTHRDVSKGIGVSEQRVQVLVKKIKKILAEELTRED